MQSRNGKDTLMKPFSAAFMMIVFLTGCGVEHDPRPNIIIISIDTMRADHLGCYGYDRNTSPTIDSLAAAGIRYSRCQAQAPHTLPAHSTIWTGLSVASHGAGTRNNITYALDPALPNIATVLGDAGYITLGMVNVAILSNDNGFATGFDYYSWNENGAGRAGETVDEYLKWIDENAGNPKPVFCFMHLFDVHSPYDPPSPFDSLFSPGGDEGIVGWRHDSLTNVVLNPEDRDHLVDMYDGEIAWVDSQLSRLFSELRARGLDDNTLIVITADHGEEFLEHGGWGHSHALWQEILHVPLIICGPGIQAGLVDTLTAGQFDILPTICGYLSIASPPNLDGVNLLDSVPRSADRSIPSSRVGMDKVFQWGVEGEEGLVSVLTGNTKAIMDFVSGQPESMYDLLSDPGEQNPMEISPEMTELLDNYWTTPQTGNPTAANSDAINEQLRGLGYIR
jgi:arylsulfatase A-like enzyme